VDDVDNGSFSIPDCNGNGFPDNIDIASGASLDTNGDSIPDECQIALLPGVSPASIGVLIALLLGSTLAVASRRGRKRD
jgi:hypothetical protein